MKLQLAQMMLDEGHRLQQQAADQHHHPPEPDGTCQRTLSHTAWERHRTEAERRQQRIDASDRVDEDSDEHSHCRDNLAAAEVLFSTTFRRMPTVNAEG